MASAKFTNVHIHVFNAACVPDNFLRIIPQKMLRRVAPQVFGLLSSTVGRWAIKKMAGWGSDKNPAQRTMKDKYIAFLNIGLLNQQQEVFELEYKTVRSVDPEARMIALTMNMDYMDDSFPEMRFTTQIEDVKNIKRYYADSFFPFYGIDPRHLSGQNGLSILQEQMESGTNVKGIYYPYFSGLKLYPALGYFPFDTRLMPVYKYAEDNLIPLMTHCTRVGSQYIGRNIVNLIPTNIDFLFPDTINDKVAIAKTNIQNRINQYYNKGWISNSKIGDNDLACDLFGHPENYVALLEHFPKLKLCLAHMGGTNEMYDKTSDATLKQIRMVDPVKWFDRIANMMCEYPNLYTDISYTLSSFDEKEICDKTIGLMQRVDVNGRELAYRVLFGTDFFMTEQEKREKELIDLARNILSALSTQAGENYWQLVTRNNPQAYLNL